MDQYLGEIRAVGFNFAPRGWALCQGQIMSIAQNTALFSLLGTLYGGNGQSTFGLPNLMGNIAIDNGTGPGLSSYAQGQVGGAASVTLTLPQVASHVHSMAGVAVVQGTSDVPSPGVALAGGGGGREGGGTGFYTTNTTQLTNMMSAGPAGGSLPHNNMAPYLTLNYMIALEGIYPPRP